jgi:antitoxin HicB
VSAFTLLLDPDEEEGGYTVTVPVLPGCITQGDTLEEALENARDAVTLHLRGFAEDGEPVPHDAVAAAVGELESGGWRFLEQRACCPESTPEPHARAELVVLRV